MKYLKHLLNLAISLVISVVLLLAVIIPRISSDSVGGMMAIAFYVPIIAIAIFLLYTYIHLLANKVLHKNLNSFFIAILIGASTSFLVFGFDYILFEAGVKYWNWSYQKQLPSIINNYKLSNFEHRLVCNDNIIKTNNCTGVEISYDLTFKNPGTYIMGFTRARPNEFSRYYFRPPDPDEKGKGYLRINSNENETHHINILLIPDTTVLKKSELKDEATSKGNFGLVTLWYRVDNKEPLRVIIKQGNPINTGGDKWLNTPEIYYSELELPPYDPFVFHSANLIK